MLSDCVIAIHTLPTGKEAELVKLLVANWDSVKSAYGGSCAPYTTLKRLAAALLRLGVSSRIVTTRSANAFGEVEKVHGAADVATTRDLRIGVMG